MPLTSFNKCCVCVLVLSLAPTALSHGKMDQPLARGDERSLVFPPQFPEDDQENKDFWVHYPAGNKNDAPGAGKKSQAAASYSGVWTPYVPYDPKNDWRWDVCGDMEPGPHHHLRGGMYYNGARIVANYTRGGLFSMRYHSVQHHNGFVECHICDAKGRGDITRDSFLDGSCTQLMRAPNPECDSGNSLKCGPIDRNYPGRWYLPPPHDRVTYKDDFWGGDDNTMAWLLPEHLECSHCVAQCIHTSADTCNPPGVIPYFEGPDAPKSWMGMTGPAGADGGCAWKQKDCGLDSEPKSFPEEYCWCFDVSISGDEARGDSGSGTTGEPNGSEQDGVGVLPYPTSNVTASPGSPGSRVDTNEGAPVEVPDAAAAVAVDQRYSYLDSADGEYRGQVEEEQYMEMDSGGTVPQSGQWAVAPAAGAGYDIGDAAPVAGSQPTGGSVPGDDGYGDAWGSEVAGGATSTDLLDDMSAPGVVDMQGSGGSGRPGPGYVISARCHGRPSRRSPGRSVGQSVPSFV